LAWTGTLEFVSDRALAVISESKFSSIVKKDRIWVTTSFRRLHCIIYEEALCAERLKETRWIGTFQTYEFY
jgi:hypothetical protein